MRALRWLGLALSTEVRVLGLFPFRPITGAVLRAELVTLMSEHLAVLHEMTYLQARQSTSFASAL